MKTYKTIDLRCAFKNEITQTVHFKYRRYRDNILKPGHLIHPRLEEQKHDIKKDGKNCDMCMLIKAEALENKLKHFTKKGKITCAQCGKVYNEYELRLNMFFKIRSKLNEIDESK